MTKLHLLLLFLLVISGCGKPLASDLNDYENLNTTTKYKILSENDSGFELGVYIQKNDFYTEKRHLVAEAKIEFRKISKLISVKRSKEIDTIDENTFISDVDMGKKAALIRNWVFYKK